MVAVKVEMDLINNLSKPDRHVKTFKTDSNIYYCCFILREQISQSNVTSRAILFYLSDFSLKVYSASNHDIAIFGNLKKLRINPFRMSECNVVKPVYKGHSREPENVSFVSSCPLYTGSKYMCYSLHREMKLPFIQ